MNESQPADEKRSIRERLGIGTVRSRISTIIIAITALSMLFVGTIIGVLQYNRVIDSVTAHLEHAEYEVRRFAERSGDEASGLPAPATTGEFLDQFMQQQLPVENEGMVGFTNGALSFHHGDLGYPVREDPELVEFIRPLTESTSTEWRQTRTSTGHFYILSVPTLGEGDDHGAMVFVVDLEAELQPVWVFLRSYTLISLFTVLLAGATAWWAAGRVMKPLARIRRLTTRISQHNLDERLPIEGTTEDLAAVSASFNSMVDRMQAAFASQYQLLDDAGHELRTPVTIVQGHLELMDVEDPADVFETRELALAELERMRRLTDDLVLLAKTERPDFLRLEPVDISDVTREAYTHARQLGDRNWSLGNTADVIISGDSQRLLQAYLQLAANAVKFSEDGSAITISSTVRTTIHGRELYLSVQDEGAGIAPENQAKVFERFARVDSRKQGAGLGLSIVSGIARAHGGDVALSSQPGIGSTFSLVLPLADDALDDEVVVDPSYSPTNAI